MLCPKGVDTVQYCVQCIICEHARAEKDGFWAVRGKRSEPADFANFYALRGKKDADSVKVFLEDILRVGF